MIMTITQSMMHTPTMMMITMRMRNMATMTRTTIMRMSTQEAKPTCMARLNWP